MTVRKKVSISDVLKVLNRALEADPDAMAKLREAKVPCNEALAHDPEIQVGMEEHPGSVHDVWEDDEPVSVGGRKVYSVGFLGVLNGIFGIDKRTGFGAIAAVYDVVCANCKLSPKDVRGLSVGDECPNCGVPLKLGPLLKFVAVDHSKLPDR
jgi:hypothetical protein